MNYINIITNIERIGYTYIMKDNLRRVKNIFEKGRDDLEEIIRFEHEFTTKTGYYDNLFYDNNTY